MVGLGPQANPSPFACSRAPSSRAFAAVCSALIWVVAGSGLLQGARCAGDDVGASSSSSTGLAAAELAGIFQVPVEHVRAALLCSAGDVEAGGSLLSNSDKGRYRIEKFKAECLALFGSPPAAAGGGGGDRV